MYTYTGSCHQSGIRILYTRIDIAMWGHRDNLRPTFPVTPQHRQLANKFPTSEFRELQKKHKVTLKLTPSTYLPAVGGGSDIVQPSKNQTKHSNNTKYSYEILEHINDPVNADLYTILKATENGITNIKRIYKQEDHDGPISLT